MAGRRPVSATVGDLPPERRALLAAAARATAATGVDIVKLGFFPGGDHRALAGALAPVAADGDPAGGGADGGPGTPTSASRRRSLAPPASAA